MVDNKMGGRRGGRNFRRVVALQPIRDAHIDLALPHGQYDRKAGFEEFTKAAQLNLILADLTSTSVGSISKPANTMKTQGTRKSHASGTELRERILFLDSYERQDKIWSDDRTIAKRSRLPHNNERTIPLGQNLEAWEKNNWAIEHWKMAVRPIPMIRSSLQPSRI